MRKAALSFAIAAAIGTAALSGVVARQTVEMVESRTLEAVWDAIDPDEDEWAEFRADGLRVVLDGTAPDERARFQLLRRVAAVVPVDRIEDRSELAETGVGTTPSFGFQLLRNLDEISLIGLVPDTERVRGLSARLSRLSETADLTDMLEVVAADPPSGWGPSLEFGLIAAEELARAKISVRPGVVTVTAVVDDQERRREVLRILREKAPDGVDLTLDISAPRPVIAPFIFAAELPPAGALRVTECAAETDEAKARIVETARGMGPEPACRIGLGAPSPEWDTAVREGLRTLAAMGGGDLRITDADILLTGPEGLEPEAFDAAIAALSEALPGVFSLSAALPPPPPPPTEDGAPAPPRFTALRTEDGAVRIRGDLIGDDVLRRTAETFAEAQFGFDTVVNETRPREDLPQGWSARVVAGLEALSLLTRGQLEVTETEVKLTGVADAPQIEGDLRRLLAARLPERSRIVTDILVEEPPPDQPRIVGVAPELCAEQIQIVLANAQITFPPGTAEIDDGSLPIVEEIASILSRCPGARFEIGGHTDSQGRESSNMALSEARAASVLSALIDGGLETVFLLSRGYGEEQPIADNGTEAGRAANRRIEFRLLTDEDEEDAAAGEGDADAGEPADSAESAAVGEASAGSPGSEPAAAEVDQAGDDVAADDAAAEDAAGGEAAADGDGDDAAGGAGDAEDTAAQGSGDDADAAADETAEDGAGDSPSDEAPPAEAAEDIADDPDPAASADDPDVAAADDSDGTAGAGDADGTADAGDADQTGDTGDADQTADAGDDSPPADGDADTAQDAAVEDAATDAADAGPEGVAGASPRRFNLPQIQQAPETAETPGDPAAEAAERPEGAPLPRPDDLGQSN